MMWVNVTVAERELETQQHLAMVDKNMAEVWVVSEQLTTRLKQCEKRKKYEKIHSRRTKRNLRKP